MRRRADFSITETQERYLAVTDRELLNLALRARGNAYAPYSHFCVGAALLAEDDRVYLGANVENSSYPATLCAERAALASAVTDGARRFTAIAIAGGKEGEAPLPACVPCGVCRQALSEFCMPDTRVVIGDENTLTVTDFGVLFPAPFTLKED